MTPPVQFGQIVWADLADANGVRKARPAVVITPSDRITASGPLEVVAITSRLPQPLPGDHILLPWHARGHPRTRLNRKCAAVCSWLARIAPTDIQSVAGIVPALSCWPLSRGLRHCSHPLRHLHLPLRGAVRLERAARLRRRLNPAGADRCSISILDWSEENPHKLLVPLPFRP